MSNTNGNNSSGFQGSNTLPVNGAAPYDPKTFEPKPGSFGDLLKSAICASKGKR